MQPDNNDTIDMVVTIVRRRKATIFWIIEDGGNTYVYFKFKLVL